MTVQETAEPPRSPLLLPPDGNRTVGTLSARFAAVVAQALSGTLDAAGPTGVALLGALLRAGGTVVRDVLTEPALAPAALVAAAGRSRLTREQVLPSLLTVLWARGMWTEPTVLRGPIRTVVLPDGIARFDPPVAALASSGPVLEVDDGGRRPVRDHPAFVAHRPLRGGVSLWGCDANPLWSVEAHPDKDGNGLSWGRQSPSRWVEDLNGALDVVAWALPSFWEGRRAVIRAIVPVGWHEERHFSASYREAPGLLYLSLHPDRLTLAEAIVHEAQHGALNLLTWTDPVLENAQTTWTVSPVRPDLRPIFGVLLAAHAFVLVAAMHRRLADGAHPLSVGSAFAARRAAVFKTNEESLQILRTHGRPTPHGRHLIEGIEALHRWSGGG